MIRLFCFNYQLDCVIHGARSELASLLEVCKPLCHHDICVQDCCALNLSLIPKCDKISIRCDSVTELILRNNKIRQLPSAGNLKLNYNYIEKITCQVTKATVCSTLIIKE